MLDKFASSFDTGDLNELKCSIVPFLKAHISEFKTFIQNFHSQNNEQPLDSLVKFFLISMNMPINFKFYLDSQSKTMETEIGPEIKNPEKRSKLVSNWIGDNAENYRAHSIMEQIYCFERTKSELLPEIEQLLLESK